VAAVAAAHGGELVRCERPGVDRARNAGWRRARHEIVLFTDDDVVVDAGWADGFVAALSDRPDAAFVTGRIETPPDQPAPARPVATKTELVAQAFDRASVGNLGHSASLAVRREALASVGGFDESLGAGGRFRSAPEADLFDRFLTAGWQAGYDPRPLAWHDQWRDGGDLARLDWRYGTGNGARLAKLVRTDRRRARFVARDAVWDWGLRQLRSYLRAGDRRAAALVVVRLTATAAGFVRALAVPVDGGHFRPGDAA
jgi:GT2 family glycosyltransferase